MFGCFQHNLEEGRGKENQSCVSSMKNKQQSPTQKSQTVRVPTKRLPIEKRTPAKRLDPPKPQVGGRWPLARSKLDISTVSPPALYCAGFCASSEH